MSCRVRAIRGEVRSTAGEVVAGDEVRAAIGIHGGRTVSGISAATNASTIASGFDDLDIVIVPSALTSCGVAETTISSRAIVLSTAIRWDKTVKSGRVDASSKLNDLSAIRTGRGSIGDIRPEVIGEKPLAGVGTGAGGAVRLLTTRCLRVADVGSGVSRNNHAI